MTLSVPFTFFCYFSSGPLLCREFFQSSCSLLNSSFKYNKTEKDKQKVLESYCCYYCRFLVAGETGKYGCRGTTLSPRNQGARYCLTFCCHLIPVVRRYPPQDSHHQQNRFPHEGPNEYVLLLSISGGIVFGSVLAIPKEFRYLTK